MAVTCVKYWTMEESELDKLLRKQVEVCGDVTEFVMISVEMLKQAVLRIHELEEQARITQEEQALKKKKKKSKKKKDK